LHKETGVVKTAPVFSVQLTGAGGEESINETAQLLSGSFVNPLYNA